jgi:hypothetical protein
MSGATQLRRSRRLVPGAVLLLAVIFAAACSKDGVTADPAVAPFVGDWAADTLILTSQADPQTSLDLVALGATFTLNVQPSGQYTAILIYSGQTNTEFGKLEVSGQTLTLHPTGSTPATAGTYSFNGDHLVLDGDTEFDFNLDGTNEPALVHIHFVKK